MTNDRGLRPSERPFVHRVEEWVERVHRRGGWVRTDFLTPRERWIADGVIRSLGAVAAWWGGYPDAERCRGLVMPEDWHPEPEDFEVTVLAVEPLSPSRLAHGAVLGSALGTGVERRRLGDIAVTDDGAWVAACEDTARFLLMEWRRVGSVPVLVRVADEPLRWPAVEYEPVQLSVASLRADAVLAQACRWPRSKAQAAIQAGGVSLNFVPLTRPDEELAEGDILSVRGFGRVKVQTILGTTRKERLRIEVGVIRSDWA